MNEDRSTRYRRLRRRADVLTGVARGCVVVALLVFGLSPALRDLSLTMTAGVPTLFRVPAQVALFVLLVVALSETAALPIRWYAELVLDWRYGLSRRRGSTWVRGAAVASTLQIATWSCAGVLIFATMQMWPGRWWLFGGGLFGAAMVAITHVAPIVVLPWLYRIRPLRRPELRRRLEALIRRAGTPVVGIHEWVLGQEAPRPNAALVGIGSTRRVLLTDALLADYSDEEIEVVLAHELGHHVHRDVWTTIVYEACVATLAFGVAHWSVSAFAAPLGIEGITDVAGLPLVAVAVGAVVTLLVPVTNWLSRRHERRADAYALEVTRNPNALVSGLRRLGAQRLAEEQPSRMVEWLFHTHPPLADRVARARGIPLTGS